MRRSDLPLRPGPRPRLGLDSGFGCSRGVTPGGRPGIRPWLSQKPSVAVVRTSGRAFRCSLTTGLALRFGPGRLSRSGAGLGRIGSGLAKPTSALTPGPFCPGRTLATTLPQGHRDPPGTRSGCGALGCLGGRSLLGDPVENNEGVGSCGPLQREHLLSIAAVSSDAQVGCPDLGKQRYSKGRNGSRQTPHTRLRTWTAYGLSTPFPGVVCLVCTGSERS